MTVKSKRHQKGIITKPTTSAATEEGEIRNDSADNKQKVYTEGAEREIITANQTQTVSNKTITSASNTITIDADTATVSNIEVDNLKAAVLETDLNNAVDDTNLASAKAVKDYVAQEVATKDEASEISYDNSTSGLTATDVQAAVDEVESRVDTAEINIGNNTTGISNHLSDATDAHDASAITNVPQGNTAATNVQGAVIELQNDIDTRALDSDLSDHVNDVAAAHASTAVSFNNVASGLTAINVQAAIDEVEGRLDTAETSIGTNATNLTNHLSDATDAHDASAISNVASGNLTATDVQGALNELQTDVDTRALDADLTSHTGASSGVHGVTGDVVGTTDTQTLTNKTITGASIEDPTRLDPKKDTKANLEVYATTANNGELVYATDTKQLFQVTDAALSPIGSGGGGLDVFYTEDFEITGAADFSTGNNATFLGAGALVGTLTDETVSPISKTKSLKYTQASGSLNDYFASADVTIDDKQAGNSSYMTVYTTYTGDSNDIKLVLHDGTNIISSELDLIQSTTNPTRFSTEVAIPSGTTDVKVGAHVIVENIGAVLVIDDIELSTNPSSLTVNLQEENIFTARIANNGSATISSQGGVNVINQNAIASVSRLSVGTVRVTFTPGFFSSSPIATTSIDEPIAHNRLVEPSSGGGTTYVDVEVRATSGTLLDEDFMITLIRHDVDYKPHSPFVVTSVKSNLTNWTPYVPTFQGLGTPTSVDFSYKIIGDEVKIQGYCVMGTTDGSEAQVSLPNSYTVKSVGSNLKSAGSWFRGVSSNDSGGSSLITKDDSFLNFSAKEVFSDTSTDSLVAAVGTSLGGSGQGFSFSATIPVNELTSDVTFLAAIPIEKVAVISEVQSSGTNGGDFNSGSPVIRTLNDIKGDTEIASVTSDRITVKKGKYHIRVEAPANAVNSHMAYLILDPAGTPITIEGTSEYSDSATNTVTRSTVDHTVEVDDELVLEVQHECGASKAGNGRGVSGALSTNETYTKVVIRKLK